ncbi:NAD-P-binding protein [Epithele typhae]|uniref:NAD-P-binding protein n=1 Tax=Epithele typhae TaxID=378194 RepID=UPI002008BAAC|nr:NAD-P-binding protein [Epithele typhae]KAH9940362.1 NAD-P-binding protein [Epithele typhae]
MHVFLLGATGYIGGSVLSHLLSSPAASRYKITAAVRSEEKAEKIRSFGVDAVLASLDDTERLEALASQADVVVECADADHSASTKAILSGLKKRHQETGQVPALIHTVSCATCISDPSDTDVRSQALVCGPPGMLSSQTVHYSHGPGVLTDNAAGMFATDTIWYDNDPDQLDTIAPSQPHREVDLAVIAADSEGYVKTFLVLPSTIYGLVEGQLVDAGIMNPQSQQIPRLIRTGIARKQAGMVGLGRNIWPNVHIKDVAGLYETILHALMEGREIGHGREGYYFGENGEHTLLALAGEIGKVLVKLGVASSEEPTTFTPKELKEYLAGSKSLGINSRCRGERSRSVGWKAINGTEDMLAGIEAETTYILSTGKMEQRL